MIRFWRGGTCYAAELTIATTASDWLQSLSFRGRWTASHRLPTVGRPLCLTQDTDDLSIDLVNAEVLVLVDALDQLGDERSGILHLTFRVALYDFAWLLCSVRLCP